MSYKFTEVSEDSYLSWFIFIEVLDVFKLGSYWI
jgi:hypothetical protein